MLQKICVLYQRFITFKETLSDNNNNNNRDSRYYRN